MPFRLVTARPGGGKTHYCIREIKKATAENPLCGITVVVPDRMQRAEWRSRLAKESGGGFIGVKIFTFHDIALSILEKRKDTRLILSGDMNSLCAQEALQKAELRYFDGIRNTPGTTDLFLNAFRELQFAHLTSQDLFSIAETEVEKDLARAYAAYLTVLSEHEWLSDPGVMAAAVEVLSKDTSIMGNVPLLIVDGFDKFRRVWLDILRQLPKAVPELLITLPSVPSEKGFTGNPFLKTEEELISYLNIHEIIHLEDRRSFPQMMIGISDALFQAEVPQIAAGDGGLTMIEASTQVEEAREALRWVKARVLRDGVPVERCAVFVPDMNVYRPMLLSFAREMGIPLFFPRHLLLSETAAAAALKLLLSLPLEKFRPSKLLSVLRTPYLSLCNSEEIHTLEKISKKMRIVEGRDQWESAFVFLMRDSVNGQIQNEHPLMPLYRKLLDLFNLLEIPSGCYSREVWRTWLKKLLGPEPGLNVRAGLNEDEGVVEMGITLALDQMTRCEKILSQSPLSYAEFLSAFLALLDSATYEAEDYSQNNAVMVGNIESAKGKRFDAAAFLGFGEGLFPKPLAEELLFSHSFRERLFLPRAKEADSAVLLHILSRSDRFTLITRPVMEVNGDEWEASVFWSEILRVGKESIKVQRVKSGPLRDLAEAASVQELLFSLQPMTELSPEVKSYLDDSAALTLEEKNQRSAEASERMIALCEGSYSGDHQERMKELFSEYFQKQETSVTSINDYFHCRLSYLFQHILGLTPEETIERGMDARQYGSLLHKILEETFAPKNLRSNDSESVLRSLDAACDRILPKAPQDYLFRPSYAWTQEQNQIRRDLRKAVRKLCLLVPLDGWQVLGTEYAFGERTKNPFVISFEDGRKLSLCGKIDRIDRGINGQFRVIDYKSSVSAAEKEKTLQTSVYARVLAHEHPVMSQCATLYFALKQGKEVSKTEYTPGTDFSEGEISELSFFLDGMEAANFDPAGIGLGTCRKYCPAAKWCRNFQKEGSA